LFDTVDVAVPVTTQRAPFVVKRAFVIVSVSAVGRNVTSTVLHVVAPHASAATPGFRTVSRRTMSPVVFGTVNVSFD
jgi:hypothetical protein